MTGRVGEALWKIYEEAVTTLPEQSDAGLANATLKFIEAFEAELGEANLDLDAKTAPRDGQHCKANFRLVKNK